VLVKATLRPEGSLVTTCTSCCSAACIPAASACTATWLHPCCCQLTAGHPQDCATTAPAAAAALPPLLLLLMQLHAWSSKTSTPLLLLPLPVCHRINSAHRRKSSGLKGHFSGHLGSCSTCSRADTRTKASDLWQESASGKSACAYHKRWSKTVLGMCHACLQQAQLLQLLTQPQVHRQVAQQHMHCRDNQLLSAHA
jgi:hypothetical protein